MPHSLLIPLLCLDFPQCCMLCFLQPDVNDAREQSQFWCLKVKVKLLAEQIV